MNGRMAKLLRKQASESAEHTAQIMRPGLQRALNNEERTRQRVDVLEAGVDQQAGQLAVLLAFKRRGLRARLRWLFLGR